MMEVFLLALGLSGFFPLVFVSLAFTMAAHETFQREPKTHIAFGILFTGTVTCWTLVMLLLKFCIAGFMG